MGRWASAGRPVRPDHRHCGGYECTGTGDVLAVGLRVPIMGQADPLHPRRQRRVHRAPAWAAAVVGEFQAAHRCG